MQEKNVPIVHSKKKEQTCQRIIQAIEGTQGLLTLAARKAGVSYKTVMRYAEEFPSVREAVQTAKESMLDYAEGKLYENIKKGDNTSIIFYLKTQGKRRGFIEKVETDPSTVNVHNQLIQIQVVNPETKDLTKWLTTGDYGIQSNNNLPAERTGPEGRQA